MTDGKENVPAYIGKEPCGCVVMAVVDDGTDPEGVIDFVSDAIRHGCAIERVTVGWVREHGLVSECPHKAKQGVLL